MGTKRKTLRSRHPREPAHQIPESEPEAEANMEKDKFEDFGELLNHLGSKGKYQKILLYAAVTPMSIIVPILYLTPIFVLHVPNHWCHEPRVENFTDAELSTWKNQNLPKEIASDGLEQFSQCKMYDSIGDEIDCPNGWDYDRSDFKETMASEFDWVCSKAHYSTTLFTAVHIGMVVGTIFFGTLADKIGRKPVLFLSLCIYLPLRLVGVFIPQYFTALVIVTFVGSLGYPLMNLIPTMILAELCDDEFRSWSVSLLWLMYVVGMAAVPYISYFGGHWFLIELVIILPSFLMLLFWFIIPESPRWLTAVGRTKEAAEILQNVAKVNGTLDNFSKNELENILVEISNKQRRSDVNKPTFLAIFKNTTLLKHMMLIIISWVVSDVIYEVITLNTPNMSGDRFLNFFLLAIVEAPSSFVGGYLLNVIGRRWTASIFFLLSSVFCFTGAGFIGGAETKIIVVISTFIAKFTNNITYLVMYLQATELLPTPLRSTGNSFATTIASCFGILVPSIVYTGTYHAGFSYLLMGALSGLAMITSTFLPETMHQELPETVQAANDFGKGNPYWKFRIASTRRKQVSPVLSNSDGICQDNSYSSTTQL